jgi:SNF2 family DNA or RNA helicase
MALTGTPITNVLFDLYTQLEWLGEGFSGFSSFEAFKKYYGKFTKRGRFNVLTEYKNVPLIQERLARLAFQIRKDEALPNLPEKLLDIVEVEMTSEQMKIYCEVRDNLMAEAKAAMDAAEAEGKPRQLIINNILTKFPVFDNEGNEIEPKTCDRLDPNPKIEALVELFQDKKPEQKTIIWACWKQDIRSITARLKLEGIDVVTYFGETSDEDRDEAVRRFNTDPKCTVFVGNPQAGGTGLNLLGYSPDDPSCTSNCDHVIYYSQTWSPTTRSQSEDRAHRRGTRVNVRYTDLCIPNTIDEEIRTRVCAKRVAAMSLQDVRVIMQRLTELTPEIGD